jgi:acyl carrier protein
MQDLKQIIYATIQSVMEDLDFAVTAIHDHDALVDDLGLKSLDLARIVAILELKIEVDPFAELVSVTSIRTVGDLCAAYAQCFATPPSAASTNSTKSDELEPSQTDPRARQRELRRNALRGA